jgi:hypothetical protein
MVKDLETSLVVMSIPHLWPLFQRPMVDVCLTMSCWCCFVNIIIVVVAAAAAAVPFATAAAVRSCSVTNNLHLAGAILRITDGLALSSIRRGSFSGNTASTLLRFEGRTWVFNASVFLEATEFLDVMYYTSYEGSSQGAFEINEEWHSLQQVRTRSVCVCVTYLPRYWHACPIINNAINVSHV